MTPAAYLFVVLHSVYLTPDGPKPRPAPIPERWLLKYAPKELPQLPDTFFTTDWHHGYFPRSLAGAYDEWMQFRRETLAAPGEVTITRTGRGFGEDRREPPRGTAVRRAPLAVYGPLVEYDGQLVTVAVSNWERGAKAKKAKSILMLSQGSAVEVSNNVWYQAGSDRATEGDRVIEYRLEFASDPRTANEGKVKVFRHQRLVAKRDGKSVEAEGTFAVNPEIKYLRDAVVSYRAGDEPRKVHLQVGGEYPPVITGISRANPSVLTESNVPVPKPPKPADPPGLVQPPKR